MTPTTLSRRLAILESARTAGPIQLPPEEAQEAARRYEASLYAPEEPDPRAEAYWATVTARQISSDYDAMLKGAPAPWE